MQVPNLRKKFYNTVGPWKEPAEKEGKDILVSGLVSQCQRLHRINAYLAYIRIPLPSQSSFHQQVDEPLALLG